MKVAESFYSIQGEGPTAGTPSVFLRLSGCNLLCGGNIKTGEYDKNLLCPFGNASWVCDTINVWKQGKEYTAAQLYDEWLEAGLLNKLKEGAHLVITGGEPTLFHSQLVEFLGILEEPFVELETNGTILPHLALDSVVNQYNVSPKLSNSGMPKNVRYKPEVIEFHKKQGSFFKFVVITEQDVKEIIEDFVNPFSLKPKRMFLMPAGVNREQLAQNSQLVSELCKQYGFNFTTRLQIVLWNKTTGV